MKITFGKIVKGFTEWFTQNQTEIEVSYKELKAEEIFETLEDFAVELFLTMERRRQFRARRQVRGLTK
jgi:hypothetical protein